MFTLLRFNGEVLEAISHAFHSIEAAIAYATATGLAFDAIGRR